MTRTLKFELDDEELALLKKEAKHLTECAEIDGVVEDDGSPLVYDLDSIIAIKLVGDIGEHIQNVLDEIRERHNGGK
jgi:hypothetical protein